MRVIRDHQPKEERALTTPSITAAQIAALVTFAGSQAVAFGLLTGSKEQTVLSIAGAAVAVALKVCDAFIRFGRTRLGVELAAEKHQKHMQGINQYVESLQAELDKAQAIIAAVKGQQAGPQA